MTIEVTYLVSVVFALVGCVGTVITILRNRKQDVVKDVEENQAILVVLKQYEITLKQLEKKVDELQLDLRYSQKTQSDLSIQNNNAIIELKGQNKSLWKVIEKIEAKLGGGGL